MMRIVELSFVPVFNPLEGMMPPRRVTAIIIMATAKTLASR